LIIYIQTRRMTSKPEITLEHFYIFNGTYAKKEGEVSMQRYVKESFSD